MRFLVTGASGLVGFHFCRKLLAQGHEVVPLSNEHRAGLEGEIQADICDSGRMGALVEEMGPEAVVHCAAMTNVDQCELLPELAMKVNVDATKGVCDAANENGARLVFISTSFVFGNSDGELGEGAKPAPINTYGTTKMLAEKYIDANADDSLILRIDQPFFKSEAWQRQDMVARTLSQLREGRPFPVFTDWHNQPTYLPDLFEMAGRLIEKKQAGIFHAVGPEKISRHDWAVKIANAFGFDPGLILPASSSDSKLPAKRPNNRLGTGKIKDACGMCPRPMDAALFDLKALIG